MAEAAKRFDLRLAFKTVLIWAACAAVLVFCAALLFASGAVSLSAMGYASSAISFLAALIATRSTGKGRTKGRALCFLLTALPLTLLPLLIGFLTAGELDGSSTLSVVSFTLSGCLIGVLLPRGRRGRRKSGGGRRKFT